MQTFSHVNNIAYAHMQLYRIAGIYEGFYFQSFENIQAFSKYFFQNT